MITIKSINVSEKKGTAKKPIDSVFVSFEGMDDDAHAGPGIRQISLLAAERMDQFKQENGIEVNSGDFGENITTTGYDLSKLQLLDLLQHNQVVLQVTQIGKSCHGKECSIFTQVGKCVMPTEGIFCRVVLQGDLKNNDTFIHQPYVFKVLVITLSDRASKGEYEDESGKSIEEKLTAFFADNKRTVEIKRELIPDDPKQLEALVKKAILTNIDFVITTGGTGVAERDITPEVIKPLLTKELPGIMEHIRTKYGAEKSGALLSRGIAGVSDKTMVVTLPGSMKAVDEYLTELYPVLFHTIYTLQGLDAH